ncbi:hypothetical protein GCM10012290_11970 [Halolactibacillus alkaliphilus]|uniref:DUF2877 domain-containing protein n=1 Tax=Halolactibacillus alkaliphilus TaxID=442899 RepID=A0A511X0T9_9BACI|nr:DUF2877 domain-containing protein [Halolactibacillus alkaliphilus]GEN56541.1 hypothetical protein HAL01_10050 [Halolactibacillus alkaliphilus]GGN69353.1 hypothetical protein GCM10012290_11970 [Halolactibacillus alkaliphilus]SFO74954.1 Protein of unknown function [Halolactibacillus alkaliphilus]
MRLTVNQIDWGLKRYLLGCNIGQVIGEVDAVYQQVINIKLKQADRLVTLAKSHVVQAPDMIKIKEDDVFNVLVKHINPSKEVYLIGYNTLMIEDYVIDFHHANLWSGRFVSYPESPHVTQQVIKRLKKFVKAHGDDRGILGSYLQLAGKTTNEKPLSLHQEALYERLELFNQWPKLEIIKQFIGLGIGLTPSGDDFLLGLFSVFNYYHTSEWRLILEYKDDFLTYTKERTTSVSYHMLKQMIYGQTNDALKALIEAENNVDVKHIERVLQIGSTSGTDMLVGVLVGLEHIYRKYIQGGISDDIESDDREECLS